MPRMRTFVLFEVVKDANANFHFRGIPKLWQHVS